MIEFEFLHSTFCIQDPLDTKSSGTGFCVTDGTNRYLITCAHVMKKSLVEKQYQTVRVWFDNRWNSVSTQLICEGNSFDSYSGNDFVVYSIGGSIKLKDGVAGGIRTSLLSMENAYFGQDMYFLGFPIGFPYSVDSNLTSIRNGITIPFAKKGIMSGVNDSPKINFIDANANPGFSGGPVFFQEENTDKKKVFGIVNGVIHYNGNVADITICTPIVTITKAMGI